MEDVVFSQIDFGLLMPLLENDDITDISYSNNGQLWVKTLSRGVYAEHIEGLTNDVVEKLAFQCSNVMGKTFNMAHPFLDAESAELRMNFVHDSIATNGVALLIRKTPAKIRLQKDKLVQEDYVSVKLHDFLITCVQSHCNILVSGETGSGKTELVKYLASHTKENEKLITIEDTLELHLDKIYPNRDIVAMKTNNIASYSDVLVTCMRQNPRWILLSEVRSGEAVMAVRNSISSGHNILSTIHSDKASSIPMRLYSLLESSQDIDQFLKSIHRYVQIGIHVKGFFSKALGRFQREITQVCEFYVDDEANEARVNVLFSKDLMGNTTYNNPTHHLIDYMASQGVEMQEDPFIPKGSELKDASSEEVINNEDDTVNNQEVINNENIVSEDNSVNNEQIVNNEIDNSVQDMNVPQSVEQNIQMHEVNSVQPQMVPMQGQMVPQASMMNQQMAMPQMQQQIVAQVPGTNTVPMQGVPVNQEVVPVVDYNINNNLEIFEI